MKNKEKDVKYCNVRKDVIDKANPKLKEDIVKLHHLYLTERHNIYKKKEIEKLPKPWTNDPVLDKYRFTNVRRELDRESKWLIENISKNNNLSLKEKILWSILFRTYNKSETFRKLGFPDSVKIDHIMDHLDKIREKIKEETIKDPEYVWFTPAFNTGGLKACWAFPNNRIYENSSNDVQVPIIDKETGEIHKTMRFKDAKRYIKNNSQYTIEGFEEDIKIRPIYLINYALEHNIADKILKANDQYEVYKILKEIPGLSTFLAYQVFVDLSYIEEFPFSENEFTIAGPGCQRGLDELFEDYDGLTYEEALFWVKDHITEIWDKMGLEYDFEQQFDHLPEEDRCLNVMMIENSFCELSKFVKMKKGKKSPMRVYQKGN